MRRTPRGQREIQRSPFNGMPGCNGKRAFPNFTNAAKVAASLRKNVDGEHAEPYRCRHCQRFHIGGNGYEKARRKA